MSLDSVESVSAGETSTSQRCLAVAFACPGDAGGAYGVEKGARGRSQMAIAVSLTQCFSAKRSRLSRAATQNSNCRWGHHHAIPVSAARLPQHA
jgi:hypothetical protein